MKSRGACGGLHLEGHRRYPVPFGCIITIPEVRGISVWFILLAGRRLFQSGFGNALARGRGARAESHPPP